MTSHDRFPSAAWSAVAAACAALALVAAAVLAPAARAADGGWPRQFDSSSGTFVIYEPQPEDLQGDMLTGRAAFSLQKPGDVNPVFGVVWFTARVQVDRDSSTVTERDLDITRVRLPRITPEEASRYEKLVEREAARWDLSGSLDELRAGLAAAEKERASVDGLSNDPPAIVFSERRAILVAYDGAPALEPIDNSNLQYVANTAYAVVFDPGTRVYYLSGANLWYSAHNPLGPWTSIGEPPAAVRDVVPPDTVVADQVDGPPPEVLTSTSPAELIATDGPPQWAPLVGDELLYCTNTESDWLRDVADQRMYVLLSGRWYAAPSQDGPWAFVRGDSLPEVFKRIPPDSPKGHLLASVAGTEAAEDAVADAEIPQTSAVRRDGGDFTVAYDGPPQFELIEGTGLRYAVNADVDVIYADGRYYACDQGVWYVADDPEGPWSVSETRPVGLEDIPPSCPVYGVRYVYVYSWTPDVIYVGYLPGYLGCYPYYGTVVYGTGYHYAPWRGRRHFIPRRHTWGFHPRYNPWLSRWGFGYTYWTGFMRVGSLFKPSPTPVVTTVRRQWFGPGGFRRPLVARDHTFLRTWRGGATQPRVADRLPYNLYSRPENVGRVDRAASRMPVRPVVSPVERPTLPNNVYAGRDGRVYQRDQTGKWKVNEGLDWKPTATPGKRAPREGDTRVAPATRRVWPEPGPFPRTTPTATPAPPQVERPAARPAPAAPQAPPVVERRERPEVSPAPGNLEREARARERAEQAPRPRGEARPERPKDDGQDGRRR